MNNLTVIASVSTPNGTRLLGQDSQGRYAIYPRDSWGEFVYFDRDAPLADVLKIISTYQLW